MNKIKILVVDDHPVVREGIKTMLATDPDLEIVGDACSGSEAIQRVDSLSPDVVLMDIRMPDMDGVETTCQIKKKHPEIAIIMLTMYEHDAYIIKSVRAGAVGYLLKDASRDLLLHTVKVARSGGTLIKSSLLQVALRELLDGKTEGSVIIPEKDKSQGTIPVKNCYPTMQIPLGLTAREIEVLDMLSKGLTNKEIAQGLYIAELTVKKHVASVINKLGVNNRSGAAVWAVRNNYAK